MRDCGAEGLRLSLRVPFDSRGFDMGSVQKQGVLGSILYECRTTLGT